MINLCVSKCVVICHCSPLRSLSEGETQILILILTRSSNSSFTQCYLACVPAQGMGLSRRLPSWGCQQNTLHIGGTWPTGLAVVAQRLQVLEKVLVETLPLFHLDVTQVSLVLDTLEKRKYSCRKQTLRVALVNICMSLHCV